MRKNKFPVRIIQNKILNELVSSTLVDGNLKTGKIKDSNAWLIGSKMNWSWTKRRTIQFSSANPRKINKEKLSRMIKIISQASIRKKKIGRKVIFPTNQFVSFFTGATTQRAPVRIPIIERQTDPIGSQLKSISSPCWLEKVCFSDPGNCRIPVDIMVSLRRIWNGASTATWVALISCWKFEIGQITGFLKSKYYFRGSKFLGVRILVV